MAVHPPHTPSPAALPVPGSKRGCGRRSGALLRAARTGLALRVARFRAAEGAMAAVEFALILPTLLLIMFASIQIVAYIDATRKVELVAHSISQMISQAAPPRNTTVAQVNAADLHFSYDSALVLFPYVMKDAKRRGVAWWQTISINYAAIQFRARNAACQSRTDTSGDLSACFDANVVWTSTGTHQPASGENYRPCNSAQLPADDDASPNRATLPRSSYGPGSLVAIDVVFDFQPTFGSGFVPAIRIARSAYVMPRYASLVNYDTTNNTGIATRCTGF